MENINKRAIRIALLLCRALLAAVFFYSGFRKLGISESFALTILTFGIVPENLAKGISIVLPWVEVLAAILLVAPRVHRIGAGLVALLCVMFMAALGWALSQGILVDCGCFGESAPSFAKMWMAVYRDIFFLALALFIVAAPGRRVASIRDGR